MRISDWSSDVCSSDLIKCVIPFCRWYEKCSIAPRIRTVSRKAKEEFVAFLSCKLNIAMVERDYAAFGDMCSEGFHIAVAPSISSQRLFRIDDRGKAHTGTIHICEVDLPHINDRPDNRSHRQKTNNT